MSRFYVLKLLPSTFGICLHPKLIVVGVAYTEGLLAHKAKHAEQMRRDGWFKFVFNYLFRKQKRLEYELEAYCVSLSFEEWNLNGVAKSLAHPMYRFNISHLEAKKLLEEAYFSSK